MSESKRDRKSKKRLFETDTPINATITMVTAGMVLSGRYYLKKEIARGGMGIVFLAEDRELEDNLVAIKVLPPELSFNAKAQQRLRKEALAAIKLSHPNILRLHSFETDGPTVYLVMEYLNGGTLEDSTFFGALDVEAVLAVARDICSALDFAHSNGVIHRDVKPANLMLHNVSGKQYAKLADLGIAFVIKDSMTRLTNIEAAGTLLYVAPEQLQGKRPSIYSDQYSLATSFYEMLSGEPPFFGPALSHQIVNGTPELIEGLPDHINKALQKALSKDPEERFGCCMDFFHALEEFTISVVAPKVTGPENNSSVKSDIKGKSGSQGTVDVVVPSPIDAITFWVKANQVQTGLALAVVVLLVFVIVLLVRPSERIMIASPSVPSVPVASAVVSVQQVVTQAPVAVVPTQAVVTQTPVAVVPVQQVVTQTPVDVVPVQQVVTQAPVAVVPVQQVAVQAPVTQAPVAVVSIQPVVTRTPVAVVATVPPPAALTIPDKPSPPELKSKFTNSVGMKFVTLSGGTFTMGSVAASGTDERPAHKVTIKKDFWMSSTEVTNSQWKKVMGSLPSEKFTGNTVPVTSVSFTEALKFCKILTKKEKDDGNFPGGATNEYTLPSESQWEYAARGGSESFFAGNGVCSSGNSDGKPGAVMKFAPNKFGLYDMAGSVWEWTLDYWHKDYKGAPSDCSVWDYDGDIDYRVLRGGSWEFSQSVCRYASRLFEVPYKKRPDIGLRIVLTQVR